MEAHSPTKTLIRLIVIALVVTWCIGYARMIILGRPDGFWLSEGKFAERSALYGGFLAATWIVFRAAPKPISKLVGVSAVTLLRLAASAVLFTGLVVTLSFLEAYWAVHLCECYDRLLVFKWLGIPLLYGSLYLYWIVIVPLWFILAAALSKEL